MGFFFEMITSPYAGIMVMAVGVLVSIFVGFSGNRKINLSWAVINALFYTGSFYLYIRNFLMIGPRFTLLVNLGLPEVILSCIMLFCGLNILFFISIHRLSDKSFIRTVILLSFSIISVLLTLIANNAVLFTVSIMLTILSIFYLLVSLEKDNAPSREYMSRFGMRVAVPAAFILFGYSLLVGTGRMRTFFANSGMDNTDNPLILISAIVFASAFYLYSFLYPFHGIFLKLSSRVDASSVPVLWFLYIPSSLVLLIKLSSFFRIFSGKESHYGFIILAVLAFTSLLGAGLGLIKSKNIKRIISMFLFFQLSTVVFVKAAGFIGENNFFEPLQYEMLALVIILVVFLPLSILAMIIKRSAKNDSIDCAQGLLRRDPYTGICIVLILIWWLIADVYVFVMKGPIGTDGLFSYGIKETILIAGFVVALLLVAVNIIRIIVVLFKKAPQETVSGKQESPRVFYVYLSFFVLLAISSLVLIIMGKADIGQDHIDLWGNTFYIFSGGK